MIVGHVPNQDPGEAIKLRHQAIDLKLFEATDRVSARVYVRRWRVGRRASSSLSAISRVMRRWDFLE